MSDQAETSNETGSKPFKLVVWDLDNTLWPGTLLEGDVPDVPNERRAVVSKLDELGILQSIASRNDPDHALEHLRRLNLSEMFLHPQIGWNAKSKSIATITQRLNIGFNSVLFIDDDPFEREEVTQTFPEVRTIAPSQIEEFISELSLAAPGATIESRKRREMYLADAQREAAESAFEGPKHGFLASLKMKVTIDHATEADLDRAEELLARTNQLNATGTVYSRTDLMGFLHSPEYSLSIVSLDDRFGSYGKIGFVVLRIHESAWRIKQFLLSCRVMSRGVGSVVLAYLFKSASESNARLQAEFKPTAKNRPMRLIYGLSNFSEAFEEDGKAVLEHRTGALPQIPDYVTLISPSAFPVVSQPVENVCERSPQCS